jgi:endonuclease/exonuclease/phosphatase family metal-dependent hydrolase
VLCLQEANGWDEGYPNRLEAVAAETGLTSYVYGDSNTQYKLATLSNVPILHSEVYVENFWHSAVRTVIPYGGGMIDQWNLHLDPGGEDSRLEEITYAVPLFHQAEDVLAVGDFNSLSTFDWYPDDLADKLLLEGITKFGVDELRRDVTNYLASQGLFDVAVVQGNTETTVPTPANKDKYHAAAMRLDYMFATHNMLQYVRDIRVIKNRLTDRISDHYPVVATLKDAPD